MAAIGAIPVIGEILAWLWAMLRSSAAVATLVSFLTVSVGVPLQSWLGEKLSGSTASGQTLTMQVQELCADGVHDFPMSGDYLAMMNTVFPVNEALIILNTLGALWVWRITRDTVDSAMSRMPNPGRLGMK